MMMMMMIRMMRCDHDGDGNSDEILIETRQTSPRKGLATLQLIFR